MCHGDHPKRYLPEDQGDCRRTRLYPICSCWKGSAYYRQAMEVKVDLADRKLHFKAFQDFLLLLGLCKTYCNQEHYEQALECLKKAEKLSPENMEVKLIKLYFEKSAERIWNSNVGDKESRGQQYSGLQDNCHVQILWWTYKLFCYNYCRWKWGGNLLW